MVLQELRKPLYCGFPCSCNAKCHALYNHVRAQLFSNRFLVTETHSQDFTYATRQPQNIVQGVGVGYRTAHTCTMLAHHEKNLEKLRCAICGLINCATIYKLRNNL